MKISSWNVKGAGRRGFKLQLKELISLSNPDLILIIETKVQPDNAKKILTSFKFDNIIELPIEGYSGGIWHS